MNDPVALTPIWGAMGDFNSTSFNCSLGDVEFDGPPYTWTNGRVWQRLDRALMNQQWSSVFSITKVSHMPRGRSDHAPLLIKCGNHSSFPTSFLFLNIWRKYKGFIDIVKEAWEISVRGVGMESFYQKVLNVKHWLREWNMKHFGRIESKIKKALELLQVRQTDFDDKRDEQSKIKLNEARALHDQQLRLESEFWRQKVAVK